jgi:hypothetical protein
MELIIRLSNVATARRGVTRKVEGQWNAFPVTVSTTGTPSSPNRHLNTMSTDQTSSKQCGGLWRMGPRANAGAFSGT